MLIDIVILATLVGGVMASLNFGLVTPANALEEHVVDFAYHDSLFVSHVTDDLNKQESRAQRTEMIEVQTMLMCLRTGPDTLMLLGVTATCDSLTTGR